MIRTVIARVGAALDRRQGWVLAALIIGLGVVLVARARAKLFWHDEVFTILASRLPVRTLWTASRDGLDLAPPLNTLLTRLVHAALGAGPVATRLPPMIGFISACLSSCSSSFDVARTSGLPWPPPSCRTSAERFPMRTRPAATASRLDASRQPFLAGPKPSRDVIAREISL